MGRHCQRLALFLAAGFLFLPSVLFSQTASDLTLELAGESRPVAPSQVDLGEFRISLGSQLVESSAAFLPERFQVAEDRPDSSRKLMLDSLRFSSSSSAGTPRNPSTGAALRGAMSLDMDSTLTLTPGYAQDTRPGVFRAGKRIGRWSVYGEVRKSTVPILRLGTQTSPTASPPPVPVRVANQVATSLTPSDPTGVEVDSSAVSLKKYYFEAVYDFLPTVKGKVSYKRSALESIDPNEKIQVEGIVKTGPDTVLKAGYGNEKTPAGAVERKKDTQVWTEFILKF